MVRHLDWANNFSIRWGLLLQSVPSMGDRESVREFAADRCARWDDLATAAEGSHHEVAEIKELHLGSIKAML